MNFINYRRGLLYSLSALCLVLCEGRVAKAATIHVPADHTTIQAAVTAASSVGDTIVIASGSYEEQVVIDAKELTIIGAGRTSTFIQSPVTLASTFTTSDSNKPVVTAKNSASVVIEDLTVDGLGRGNGNVRFHGIAYYNAGGAVLGCDVVNIAETPASGNQHGVGIYSFNDSSGPYALEVGDCDVTGFQKNAMALSGIGMTVDVHDCSTIGAGDIAYTAQNGIQVSYGAGGTISDCTVANIRYTPATWVASGILIYQGTTVTMSGDNVITNVQAPVSWYDTNGICGGCEIPSGGDFDAIFVYNSPLAAAPGNSHPLPEPWLEAYHPGDGQQLVPYAVSVTGGCLTGMGAVNTSGIYVLTDTDPLTVDITNMTISGWDNGIYLDGAGVDASATDNSIFGNLTAGLDNTVTGNPVDAELNWWGAADGPSGVGTGSGDAILGAGVDFDPWRTSAASDDLCAFIPVGINLAGPVSPGTCISSDSTCVAVDVDIARTDNIEMRGFSVDIELTDLLLCGAGIEEGQYLDTAGNTVYHVVTNGGGSYTVDCALLGSPCGQDLLTGTLFTVNVQKDSVEGSGTIKVTDVTFRDCVNAPIPGTPGDSLSLVIDTIAPVAVANVTASQVTAGNDADGTTEVTVAFTTPGDAVDVMVYRAPFGAPPGVPNSYPEYDDEAGSGAPVAPSYPPVAPWQLTSLAAPGNDETTERGYWYYVVFTADNCGNVSLASNVGGGALNYHLGDVSNGSPGSGDNEVGVLDMSLLGAHYGIAIAHNDPVNYLDVGPTTDSSPNSLPLTDNLINFDDLIIFAINHGQVSATGGLPEEFAWSAVSELPRVKLVLGPSDARGMADLHVLLHGHEQLVKGLHVVVDGLSMLAGPQVTPGALIADQTVPVFFKALPGERQLVIDVAALGNGVVLDGSGEIASIRVPAGARPHLALADMRDARNRRIEATSLAAMLPARDAGMAKVLLPTQVELLAARPNPFAGGTNISFRLPEETSVSVDVFDVNGRLVRSLTSQRYPAGEHLLSWDGRNDQGQGVGSGIYLVRMRTDAEEHTQKVFRQR